MACQPWRNCGVRAAESVDGVIAEFGIDDEGRAYVCLNNLTQTEWNMIERLKAFLPVRVNQYSFEARIVGDRMPGMGNLTSQDASR